MLVAEYHFFDGSVEVGRCFLSLESFVAWSREPYRQESLSKLGVIFVSFVEVDETGLA